MLIRRMCEEDLAQVSDLEKENFSQPWSENAFAEELRNGNSIYMVCEEQGSIVGACGVIFSVDYGEIMNVSVKKAVRRKGVAYQMLERLLLEAEAAGYHDFTLEVRKSNQAAIALYEKLGFLMEGVRPRMYQFPTEDGIIYWKRD